LNVSEILFKRLNAKANERDSDASVRLSQMAKGDSQQNRGKDFQEWLKHKDAEKRLKKKLIYQAQLEVKEELLQVAK